VALYLVGEKIDAKRAHLRAQTSELIQLIRGVYADQADISVRSRLAWQARERRENAQLLMTRYGDRSQPRGSAVLL
jgi:hypothetical protein